MRLLILDENYPHADNLLGSVFTHVRVKEYAKKHEVRVFSFFHTPREITYEGIDIEMFDDAAALLRAAEDFNPDKIIIHFFKSWMFDELILKMKRPFLIWVHGYEVIGWYRRLYNWNVLSPLLLKHAVHNFHQQFTFRKFIRYANRHGNIKFIFVSDWMKRIAQYDTLSSIRNFSIIPNPIDTELFSFKEKSEDKRLKVLLLRSFESRKYANDISVNAIKTLSRRPIFREFNFKLISVYGNMFETIIQPVKDFDNVLTLQQSVPHQLIPGIHSEFGVFLCPTRQDSQGVSMCEAMASGLVPVTSQNTAIPEFVADRKDGFLTRSADEIADVFEFLYDNPQEFLKLSKAASEKMRNTCSLRTVITAELKEIEQ